VKRKKIQRNPEDSKAEEQKVKGVPEFWLLALKHHEDFSAMITEADEQALKNLTDIRIAAAPEHSPESFTIEFHFSDNEFFDNKLIKKTYILKENPSDGEMMYDHVESTDIIWKPNKNLTVKKVTKQQKKKGAKGGRGKQGSRGGGPTQTVTVEEPTESFFYFFTPESAYAVYGGADEDQEEEFDDGGLAEFLELDYELGLELQEKLIPHAIMFFTGENIAEEEEEGEDEEEEDEDQEENDEEDEEEFEPPKEATTSGQPQNPECKQQ